MKNKQFILIAGPCVIESQQLLIDVAGFLKETLNKLPNWNFYFKSSFDKANRSAGSSFRGPGLEQGLKMLAEVKRQLKVKILTDVHESHQCEPVASVVDALQVPAFLCRQTDLVEAAALAAQKHRTALNIKKGQFLAPWDMKNVVDKVSECTQESKPQWLWLTERGSSFGYNNLVVDMTSFPILRQFEVPVIFDATHSVQLPGAANGGKVTGGRREFIEPLAKAAMAVGIDGLFIETHPIPEQSKSDAANAFRLQEVPLLLNKLEQIRLLGL